jgi:chromosomal replication initiation ATPase DnaA
MNQVAKMTKETIDPWMMVGKLSYADTDYEGTVAIDQCVRGVKRLGISWNEVQSTSRVRRIVDARRLCCLHLRNKGWTFDRIARSVGYTHHATALYQVRITEELIKYDNQFKSMHLKFIQA